MERPVIRHTGSVPSFILARLALHPGLTGAELKRVTGYDGSPGTWWVAISRLRSAGEIISINNRFYLAEDKPDEMERGRLEDLSEQVRYWQSRALAIQAESTRLYGIIGKCQSCSERASKGRARSPRKKVPGRAGTGRSPKSKKKSQRNRRKGVSL